MELTQATLFWHACRVVASQTRLLHTRSQHLQQIPWRKAPMGLVWMVCFMSSHAGFHARCMLQHLCLMSNLKCLSLLRLGEVCPALQACSVQTMYACQLLLTKDIRNVQDQVRLWRWWTSLRQWSENSLERLEKPSSSCSTLPTQR